MTRAMATMAVLLLAFSAAAAEESSCPAACTKGVEELKSSFEEFRATSAAETKGLRVMIEAILASRAGAGEGNGGDGGAQGGAAVSGDGCVVLNAPDNAVVRIQVDADKGLVLNGTVSLTKDNIGDLGLTIKSFDVAIKSLEMSAASGHVDSKARQLIEELAAQLKLQFDEEKLANQKMKADLDVVKKQMEDREAGCCEKPKEKLDDHDSISSSIADRMDQFEADVVELQKNVTDLAASKADMPDPSVSPSISPSISPSSSPTTSPTSSPTTTSPTMSPTTTPDVWVNSAASIVIISSGTVATHNGLGWKGVAGGKQMVTGVHYWEVTVTVYPQVSHPQALFGVSRPGLSREQYNFDTKFAWYMNDYNGALYGNGQHGSDPQGAIALGDRIGMLLDLDAGSLTYYRNGQVYGPGFPSGVTGPVVHTVEMLNPGTVVSLDVTATRPQ